MSSNDIESSEKSSSALSAEAAEFVPTSVSNSKTAIPANSSQSRGPNHPSNESVKNFIVAATSPAHPTAVWKNGIAGGIGLPSSSSSSMHPQHSATATHTNVPPPLPYMMNCFPFLPQNGSIRPQLTRFSPPYNIPPDLSIPNGMMQPHPEGPIPFLGHQMNPANFNALPTDPTLGLHSASDSSQAHPPTGIIPNASWLLSLGQPQQQQFISAPPHQQTSSPQQPPSPLRPPQQLGSRFYHRPKQRHPHPLQQQHYNISRFQYRPGSNQFPPNFTPPSNCVPPPPHHQQPPSHRFAPANNHYHKTYNHQIHHHTKTTVDHTIPNDAFNKSTMTQGGPVSLSTSSSSSSSSSTATSASLVMQITDTTTTTVSAVVATSTTTKSSPSLVSSVSDGGNGNVLRGVQRDGRTGRKRLPDCERPSSPVLISRSSQTDKIPLGVKDLTLQQRPHPIFIKRINNKKSSKGNNCDTTDISSTCNIPTSVVEEVVFDQNGCVSIQASPADIDKFFASLVNASALTPNFTHQATTATTTTTTSINVTTTSTSTTTTTSAFTGNKRPTRTSSSPIVSYSSKLASKPSSHSSTDSVGKRKNHSEVGPQPASCPTTSQSAASLLQPSPSLITPHHRNLSSPVIEKHLTYTSGCPKSSSVEDDRMQGTNSQNLSLEDGKRRRRRSSSSNQKKQAQEKNTDSKGGKNNSAARSSQSPRRSSLMGTGWEKNVNDDKINLQSWTDFPPMNNNSNVKSSSTGGVGGGRFKGRGEGDIAIPSSSTVSNDRQRNMNNNDEDISSSGPVLIQRVQGAPPWSLKEQRQQQQQLASGETSFNQPKSTTPIPSSSVPMALSSSSSASLPLNSYATKTAGRIGGGGGSRDNAAATHPTHSINNVVTKMSAHSSQSSPPPYNKNPVFMPSSKNPHPSFPAAQSPVHNDYHYPPLSSNSSSPSKNSSQPRLVQQPQSSAHSSHKSGRSHSATDINNQAIPHSHSSHFPPLISSATDDKTDSNTLHSRPHSTKESNPKYGLASPITAASSSPSYSKISSQRDVGRGNSKSPGRNPDKTMQSLERNKSKSPARFLKKDDRDIDSLSYAERSKIKQENFSIKTQTSLRKCTERISNDEEGDRKDDMDEGKEFQEDGEGDEEKSTTKRRRQRRRRRNHVRTKKGSGGGDFIANDADDGDASATRSMSGDNRAGMMLHFEDTEEFPDLLASVSRGHSQDAGNVIGGDRSSLSGTSVSYSDMAKNSWSRREQSLSRTQSLTGSCVSEDNTEDNMVETKRARKRRKRREQANKAAETELAEISLEQELLREGLKKTGGMRSADRWKNQSSPGLISSPAVVREVKKGGGGTSSGSGKKSKQPIAIDLAAMIEASKAKLTEKHSPKSSIKGDSRSSSAKRSTHSTSQSRPSNPLDSTAPVQRRGKEREFPKTKKPSPLKKVILKEREAKKQMRLLDGKDMDEFGNPHGVGMVGVDSELSQDAMSSKSEGTDLERTGGGSQPTNLSADLSPISQTSPISMSPASPGNSGVNSPVTGSVGRDSIIQKIHSRRFREYCNQVLDKDIDQCCTDLLQDLVRFQDRLYHKDPMRAKRKRRVVLGLREVTKHLRLKKIKCVVISPNLEKIQSKGGLDEALNNILNMCQEQDVPFVFALGRRALGRACAKLVPVSVVGVFSYQNCEENYNKLISLTAHARSAYNEMVAAVEKEVAATSTFNAVPGLIPAHMGHSRTPSGCSAISFTSSVISEPHSEYYSSYADELRISDGNSKNNNQGQGYNNDLDDGNEADIEDLGGDPGRKMRGGGVRGSNSVRFDSKSSGGYSSGSEGANNPSSSIGNSGNISVDDRGATTASSANDVGVANLLTGGDGNSSNNNNSVIGDAGGGKSPTTTTTTTTPHPLHHNHNHHNHIHGHHRRQSSVSSLARIMEGIDDDKEEASMNATNTAVTIDSSNRPVNNNINNKSIGSSSVSPGNVTNKNIDGALGTKAAISNAVNNENRAKVNLNGGDDVATGRDERVEGGSTGKDIGADSRDLMGTVSDSLKDGIASTKEGNYRQSSSDALQAGGGGEGVGMNKDERAVGIDDRNRTEGRGGKGYDGEVRLDEDYDNDIDEDIVDDVEEDEVEDDEDEEDDDVDVEAAVASSRNRLRGHTRQKSMDKKERIENWLSAQSNLTSMD